MADEKKQGWWKEPISPEELKRPPKKGSLRPGLGLLPGLDREKPLNEIVFPKVKDEDSESDGDST